MQPVLGPFNLIDGSLASSSLWGLFASSFLVGSPADCLWELWLSRESFLATLARRNNESRISELKSPAAKWRKERGRKGAEVRAKKTKETSPVVCLAEQAEAVASQSVNQELQSPSRLTQRQTSAGPKHRPANTRAAQVASLPLGRPGR